MRSKRKIEFESLRRLRHHGEHLVAAKMPTQYPRARAAIEPVTANTLEVADLVIVGFGPVGASLAGLAARRGLSVVVLERDPEIFALPRAVQCDHEILRILQELGIAEEILADTVVNDGIAFLTADRRDLLRLTLPAIAPTGWPPSVFFHQPSFEAVLRRRVIELGAQVRLGVEVVELAQSETGVTAVLPDGSEVRARFGVGCDGARSSTRAGVGGSLVDTGFEESWLVVDLLLSRPVPGLPTRCYQVCDPARPHTLVPMPGARFRFEFMLLAGETPESIQEPASVRRLLSAWMDPEAAVVERAAVYTFHGLVASRWRDRRIFLAGDAAHQTPPFLGQGMCAGMRDVANLAWKLAAVIDGSPDELLDTYQLERQPHAQQVIDAAVEFGRLICMTDPEEASARDEAMLDSATEPSEAPDLIPPLLAGPAIGLGGGALSVQPALDGILLDDLVGPRFCLVVDTPLDKDSPEADWWTKVALVIDVATRPELAPLLDGAPACAIRPDRYVLARGALPEITALSRQLLGPLQGGA